MSEDTPADTRRRQGEAPKAIPLDKALILLAWPNAEDWPQASVGLWEVPGHQPPLLVIRTWKGPGQRDEVWGFPHPAQALKKFAELISTPEEATTWALSEAAGTEGWGS